MIRFRIQSMVAVILAFIALSMEAVSQQKQWDLKVELAKEQYVLHEPIWLDVTLTNTGTDAQTTDGLTAPNHRQFNIEVRDSLSDRIEYTGPLYDFVSEPGRLLLDSEEQDFGSFDLVDLFGHRKDSSGVVMGLWFHYIPTGFYTIRVQYEGVMSEEFAFSVVEPSGEEAEALKLIEQASLAWREDDRAVSAEILRDVVEATPDGPFAEMCFFLTEFYSPEVWTQGTNGDRLLKRTMLEHHPNSGWARDWIASITRDMDEQAMKEFLDGLTEAHPGTRSAKYASLIRDRVNKQKASE